MNGAEASRRQIRIQIRRGMNSGARGAIRSLEVFSFAALPVLLAVSLLTSGMAVAGPIGAFNFEPLAESSRCVAGGPDYSQVPLTLPTGFSLSVLATEGATFPDQADMNTLNETGAHAGQFLYHTHEVRDQGAISVTNLADGTTRLLDRESHWERLDGIEWTPWHTLLFAEEVRANRTPRLVDPAYPHALGGLVYEMDPTDPSTATARPAIGSRAHEGLAFDGAGNLYGIAEVGSGGAIFKFVPDRRGDLSSGQPYALKVVSGAADKTGEAIWVPLEGRASEVDSEAESVKAGATKWLKPEDLEVYAETLFVAISDEHRIIAIDLRQQRDAAGNETAFVWDYVKAGLNAPTAEPRMTSPYSFAGPDNIAFDPMGHLYISEDSGGKAPQRTRGNDVWVAVPSKNPGAGVPAESVVLFASMTDCNAEPSGIYFDRGGHTLYLHVMHRGGSAPGDLNLPDQSIAIRQD